jgi:NSS family neurotransmitter:Na+ symporter
VLLLLSPTVLKGKNRIESISRIVVPIFFGFILFITSFIIIQPGIFSSIIDLLTKNSINTQVNSYTFIAALGQGFFSLCLGGTYMVLYASYMGKKENHDIPLNAGLTVIGNTFASLMSMILVFGIIVFSGINNFTSFGPGLFFSVIPEAFQQIGINIVFRQILLMLFFTMFFLSAYLPMVAILEVLITFTVKKFNVSRKKAFILIAPTLLIAAIPSVLSPLEGGFLYNLDIFVGALGSVFGSIMALLAFGWFIRKKDVMEIVNENSSSKLKFGEKWYFLTKYVTPFAIIFVILYALSDVIVGYFALNTIPENNYIFYSFIVEIAPVIAISLLIFSVLLYFITKRFSKIV